MNIAHLLPYASRFPAAKHNGRVEWAIRLAKIQASRGHTVSVYCAPGSGESVPELHWCSTLQPLDNPTANNTALIEKALQNPEHDIFHSHFDSAHYPLADLTSKPIVVTQHWFPNEDIAKAAHDRASDNVYTVPVTKLMQQEDERLSIPATEMIYHGIDLTKFSYSEEPRNDRLVFVGRIAPHKGVREAVAIAKQAGAKLDIIGKVEAKDEAYWQEILPFVDGEQIRYLGAKNLDEVAEFFSHAKAFIFPSQKAEAFGQVTIEAQACGAPVIIYDIGASSELVQDGVTGFVVTNEEDFVKAIKKLPAINRKNCRTFAETFDVGTMIEKYERLYERVLNQS